MSEKITEYHGICDNTTDGSLERILFVDIDGVLVTDFSKDNLDSDHVHLFNPISVNILNKVVEITDCYIVISSSWRKRDLVWMRRIFNERGFKYTDRIIGETMRGYHFVERGAHIPIPRGVEIKAWLDLFVRKTDVGFTNNNYQYAIVDDDADMLLEQTDYFVQTDSEKGLTLKDGNKLIYIFNN